jgi:cytochrome b6-f complex iron-sulfur subunit
MTDTLNSNTPDQNQSGQAAPDSTQPAAPTTSDPGTDNIDRRTFIKWTAVGWTAFAVAVGGYGTMVLRYLFPNVLFEPKQTFRAGYPDDYQPGEVSLRWKDRFGVWIVRDNEKIYALSTVCTHLGCTPNWLPNENKFKCPCHGSGFYKTGINFEGPAPRPLERYRITLADDGQIIVDKTRAYQQEKGEWKDPDSYLLA